MSLENVNNITIFCSWVTSWVTMYVWHYTIIAIWSLMLWVRFSLRVRCTTLCDKVCQWRAAGLWFSPGPPVSSTNKTDCHDIAEIFLKVALNTIKQKQIIFTEVYAKVNMCFLGSRDRHDYMVHVVGFTTTYAIGACHMYIVHLHLTSILFYPVFIALKWKEGERLF